MTGPEAKAAFTQAAILVVAGKYDDALAIPLLPSDRKLIERKIEEHMAAGANTHHE